MAPSGVARSRARTAMRRGDLSVPVQHVLNMGILGPSSTYFDYGCGRGDDIKVLAHLGIRARGWDPVHAPQVRRTRSDVVACNYVINVIDRADERIDVIRSAWSLSKRALVVAARLEHEQSDSHAVAKGDGWITSKGTFQKFYSHEELGEVLSGATGTPCDAVAPGVFAVFRDPILRQDWKARRMRTPSTPRLKSYSAKQLDQYKVVLNPMIDFVLARGRLPQGEELEEFESVITTFGSPRLAFQVIVRATDREAWKSSAIERAVDLLAFLALGQFDGIDRMGKLSMPLQRDIRAHYGSFKSAHAKAVQLLFASGKPQAVDLACRASRVGKLTPSGLYVHRSALPELPALLRVVIGCGQRLIGDITEANVIKIFRSEPALSFLEYPEFEINPHPWLNRTWHLDLHQQRLRTVAFGHRANRPILHRLHHFVAATHVQYSEWESLTKKEEAAGLYNDPSVIGTEDGWRIVSGAR